MADSKCGCLGIPGKASTIEINTDNCPNDTTCTCTKTLTPASTCTGTSDCCCNNCQCQSQVNEIPTPYYACAGACQEDHSRVIVQQQYVTGITIQSSFVMPACNETTVVTVPGLQKISIGSYVWNPNYGYLKVVGFDYAQSQVILENECTVGNAAPGTSIPACTLFTIVDAPPGVIVSPCDEDLVDHGTPLVCLNGSAAPLEGSADNQHLVLYDSVNNLAQFQSPCDWDLSSRIVHSRSHLDSGNENVGTVVTSLLPAPFGQVFGTSQLIGPIQNNTCSDIRVSIDVLWRYQGELHLVAAGYGGFKMGYLLMFDTSYGLIGTTAAPVPATIIASGKWHALYIPAVTLDDSLNEEFNYHYEITIAPGFEFRVGARAGLQGGAAIPLETYTIERMQCEIWLNYLGINP